MADHNNEEQPIVNNNENNNQQDNIGNNNNQQGNNQQGNNNNNNIVNMQQLKGILQHIIGSTNQFEQAINIINNNNNLNRQNQQQQDVAQNQVVRELQNVEAQQQINQIREIPKTFSNKNKKDCEIGTIFKIFEAKNKHNGHIRDVCKRLIDHFNDEALSTFMKQALLISIVKKSVFLKNNYKPVYNHQFNEIKISNYNNFIELVIVNWFIIILKSTDFLTIDINNCKLLTW
ncbi:hypothetical protein ACTFIU_002491 [Dictyostelium citrinum]